MKTIKIFLASSDELGNDRNAFGNLVRKLNDIYKKRGGEIELVRWEDLPAHYQGRRTQDMYNEIISDCNMFTAVFHKVAGKFTIEEFDVARENFDKKSFPKVYTYVKDLAKDESESIELTEFKKKLYDELGHYWCRYGNEDTMQLHFVMQLYLLEADSHIELEVKDSKVLLDNHQIADLDNVPYARDNEEYIRLKNKVNSKTKEFVDSCALISSDPTNSEYIQNQLRISTVLNDTKNELMQYEQALFDISLKFARIQTESTNSRTKQAMFLFDKGLPNEAKKLLNSQDRKLRTMQCFEQKEELDKSLIAQINENVAYAYIIMASFDTSFSERVTEADEAYQEAIKIAKKININEEKYAKLLFDYAGHTQNIKQVNKAINIYNEALQIYKRYRRMSSEMYTVEIIQTLNNIGILYTEVDRHEDAKEIFIEALNITREFAEKKPNVGPLYLASTLSNLGTFYSNINHYKEAELYYIEALRIKRELPYNTSIEGIAIILNGLGNLYAESKDLSNAEVFYLEALKTYRELSVEVSNSYVPKVASILNNMAILYNDIKRYQEAEDNFRGALSIFMEASTAYSGIYLSDVAIVHNGLGSLYKNIKKIKDAEFHYLEALRIMKELSIANTNIYQPDMMVIFNNVGNLYSDADRLIEAEKFYDEALQISKVLATATPDKYKPSVAMYLINLGHLYKKAGRHKESEEAYQESLQIYRKSSIIADIYIPYTATVLYSLGNLYLEDNCYKKAEDAYLEALKIKKELSDVNPFTHLPLIAEILYKLGDLHTERDDCKCAEVEYIESLSIYRDLANTDNEAYVPYIFWLLTRLGILYSKLNKHNEAKKYLSESVRYLDENANVLNKLFPKNI